MIAKILKNKSEKPQFIPYLPWEAVSLTIGVGPAEEAKNKPVEVRWGLGDQTGPGGFLFPITLYGSHGTRVGFIIPPVTDRLEQEIIVEVTIGGTTLYDRTVIIVGLDMTEETEQAGAIPDVPLVLPADPSPTSLPGRGLVGSPGGTLVNLPPSGIVGQLGLPGEVPAASPPPLSVTRLLDKVRPIFEEAFLVPPSLLLGEDYQGLINRLDKFARAIKPAVAGHR